MQSFAPAHARTLVFVAASVTFGCGSAGQERGSAVDSGGPSSGPDATAADVVAPSADSGSLSFDGGPPIVLPCAQLGDAGVWENITPPLPQAPAGSWVGIPMIAGDPRRPGTLYAGSGGYGVSGLNSFWKTTDCGATWTQPATGLNGDKLVQGGVQPITVDPVDSSIYAESFYGTGAMYKSTNGGVDWSDVSPSGPGIPGFLNGWSVDPTDHNHLIAPFHDDCYTPDGGHWAVTDAGPIDTCFAETYDGAMTWRFLPGVFPQWGEGLAVPILGGQTWMVTSPFGGLHVTTDDGTSWTQPITYPGCMGDVVVVSGTYYLGCFGMPIQTSTDGLAWSGLANSPSSGSLVLTGKYMYSDWWDDTSGQPVWRAPLSDLTQWERLQIPGLVSAAGAADGNVGALVYDQSHSLLYVSAQSAGLWRVVTE
jgi:hypothetical protein